MTMSDEGVLRAFGLFVVSLTYYHSEAVQSQKRSLSRIVWDEITWSVHAPVNSMRPQLRISLICNAYVVNNG